MFSWKKLGNVFNPVVAKASPWMQEYAQCPTPFLLNEKVIRVYVASRPAKGNDLQYVSYPGYVDLDRDNITRVVGVSDTPLLQLGRAGSFDEFGIMPSSFVRTGDEVYTYYSGWTRMKSVPYTLAIGVASSDDGGTRFRRLGEGPVLGLSRSDPYFVTGPVVRKAADLWRMWYLTCLGWKTECEKFEPIYRIALATSTDGINWKRDGNLLVSAHSDHECQDILAPFFLGDRWHAIFAWRDAVGGDGAYRLGYASSEDLKTWKRDDKHAGLMLSPSGWDSKMMCYPQVLQVDSRVLLFYCGNDFGKEGFGIAEMTSFDP